MGVRIGVKIYRKKHTVLFARAYCSVRKSILFYAHKNTKRAFLSISTQDAFTSERNALSVGESTSPINADYDRSPQYLADLKAIRKAYAQDVKENCYVRIISQPDHFVNKKQKLFLTSVPLSCILLLNRGERGVFSNGFFEANCAAVTRSIKPSEI